MAAADASAATVKADKLIATEKLGLARRHNRLLPQVRQIHPAGCRCIRRWVCEVVEGLRSRSRVKLAVTCGRTCRSHEIHSSAWHEHLYRV